MHCTFELNSPYYMCEELPDGERVALIACVKLDMGTINNIYVY